MCLLLFYHFIIFISISSIIIIAILLILVINYYKKTENIKETKELWKLYDESLEVINMNLDIIELPAEEGILCGNAKNDTNIYDKSTINRLVCAIKIYYYNLIEYSQMYHNHIIKYRYKNRISYKNIKILKNELAEDIFLFKNLSTILSLNISNNNEKKEEFKNEINKVLKAIDNSFYRKDDLTYAEMLEHKITEIENVANFTNWLKENIVI